MSSQLGGYRSPVDLGLGRQPGLTGDVELFGELTEIYNSIHLLASYMDALRLFAQGGGSGQNPDQTMPFTRFFPATALMDIELGMPVAPSGVVGDNGVTPGALGHLLSSTVPECNFCGIALTGATAGNPIRVGVGPAILGVPGVLPNGYVWAYSARATAGAKFGDGGLYLSNPGAKTISGIGTAYAMPVAIGVANDYALFGNFIRR